MIRCPYVLSLSRFMYNRIKEGTAERHELRLRFAVQKHRPQEAEFLARSFREKCRLGVTFVKIFHERGKILALSKLHWEEEIIVFRVMSEMCLKAKRLNDEIFS